MKNLYSFELVGSKSIIPRTREVMKYMLSSIDPENYDING